MRPAEKCFTLLSLSSFANIAGLAFLQGPQEKNVLPIVYSSSAALRMSLKRAKA